MANRRVLGGEWEQIKGDISLRGVSTWVRAKKIADKAKKRIVCVYYAGPPDGGSVIEDIIDEADFIRCQKILEQTGNGDWRFYLL